jgi:hypothetical protein
VLACARGPLPTAGPHTSFSLAVAVGRSHARHASYAGALAEASQADRIEALAASPIKARAGSGAAWASPFALPLEGAPSVPAAVLGGESALASVLTLRASTRFAEVRARGPPRGREARARTSSLG